MKEILYCQEENSKRKLSLPYPLRKTSKIKEAYKEDFPLVIFEEHFAQRKDLNPSLFDDKICLIHFSQENKNNLKTVKKLGFFDYVTNQDTKNDILFKLERAERFLEAKRRINDLERGFFNKEKKLEKDLLIDPLTGCYNWRYFIQRTHQELIQAKKYSSYLSFIVIDIDYFRQINEIYNVKIADSIIKELVEILRSNLRKEDILTRWREDEFFIILPHLSRNNAYKKAKIIHDKLILHKFKYRNLRLNIKVSMGVVSFLEDKITSERDAINALNNCLIAARKKGGNTVTVYSSLKSDNVLKEKEETTIKTTVNDLKNKIKKLNNLLSRDILEMIYGFTKAIEAKDLYTGKHVEYTVSIAEEIAKELKLPPLEVENIKYAAVLHDLGKVGIEENILSKKGPLTPKERKAIEAHPWIATEILREVHSLRGALPAILYHHERYSGKGYPFGLKGEEIPLAARIIAIADTYQALISHRPYRKAYTKKEAIKIIKEESGEHFDPKIVKVFLKVIKRIPYSR